MWCIECSHYSSLFEFELTADNRLSYCLYYRLCKVYSVNCSSRPTIAYAKHIEHCGFQYLRLLIDAFYRDSLLERILCAYFRKVLKSQFLSILKHLQSPGTLGIKLKCVQLCNLLNKIHLDLFEIQTLNIENVQQFNKICKSIDS